MLETIFKNMFNKINEEKMSSLTISVLEMDPPSTVQLYNVLRVKGTFLSIFYYQNTHCISRLIS